MLENEVARVRVLYICVSRQVTQNTWETHDTKSGCILVRKINESLEFHSKEAPYQEIELVHRLHDYNLL